MRVPNFYPLPPQLCVFYSNRNKKLWLTFENQNLAFVQWAKVKQCNEKTRFDYNLTVGKRTNWICLISFEITAGSWRNGHPVYEYAWKAQPLHAAAATCGPRNPTGTTLIPLQILSTSCVCAFCIQTCWRILAERSVNAIIVYGFFF